MQNKPLVSVIIPAYNRAKILQRAIESVLAQSYQNFEIIIVDDASTDLTAETIKNFLTPKIRYFKHKNNKGPGAARNTGIKKSRGELIAFLDSDDQWLPEKLEKQIEIFKKAPKKIALVGTNHYVVSLNGKKIGIKKTKPKRRLTPTLPSWVLYKRVFKKIGLFDQRFLVNEDTEFFSRFRRKFSFDFIDTPLFDRYLSDDGISRDIERMITKREKYLPKLKSERRLYAQHTNKLGKDYCQINQVKKAKECFLKAFIAYPLNLGYLINFLRIKPKWISDNNIIRTKSGRYKVQI